MGQPVYQNYKQISKNHLFIFALIKTVSSQLTEKISGLKRFDQFLFLVWNWRVCWTERCVELRGFRCGTKGCVELRDFWCWIERCVELKGVLNWRIFGVELRVMWNWEIFGLELRGFWCTIEEFLMWNRGILGGWIGVAFLCGTDMLNWWGASVFLPMIFMF